MARDELVLFVDVLIFAGVVEISAFVLRPYVMCSCLQRLWRSLKFVCTVLMFADVVEISACVDIKQDLTISIRFI